MDWISVSEKKPPNMEFVLVYGTLCSEYGFFVGQFCEDPIGDEPDWWFSVEDMYEGAVNPLWWAHLPQPPEVSDGQ